MHGIKTIQALNQDKKDNTAWLAAARQPKSVFGPSGQPAVSEPKPQAQAQ